MYGECNCGAVAFEISMQLKDVYACHCSICRRYTGAGGIYVVVFPNEAFKLLRGAENITQWSKPDADWQSWFCKTCGSALPGKNDDANMYAPAGLITEGGENLKVAQHFFVGSKAEWEDIGGDAPQRN